MTPHTDLVFSDSEYDIRGLIAAPSLAEESITLDDAHRVWEVWRPSVQWLTPGHIYPGINQFADWEINSPVPQHIQRVHP